MPTMEIVEEVKPTVEEYIRQTAQENNINENVWLAIAQAESNTKETAYNPEWHRGCQGSYGVFQIACLHYPEDPNKLFDPYFNIDMAVEVYHKQGLRAWGVCTNGKVNCGL